MDSEASAGAGETSGLTEEPSDMMAGEEVVFGDSPAADDGDDGGAAAAEEVDLGFREDEGHSDPKKKTSVDIKLDPGDISLILGAFGTLKKKIQRAADVRIEGSRSAPVLRITGTPECQRKAIKYINFIHANRVDKNVVFNPETDDDGDVTILHIPEEAVGFVAGKRSCNFRDLELYRDTLIFFVTVAGSSSDTPSGGKKKFQDLAIFGNKFNRRCCELKILASQEQRSKGSVTVNVHEMISDERVGTDVVEIQGQVSYAFGVQGKTKRKLENASGCVIEYIGKYAHIFGLKERRERAREYLEIVTRQKRSLDAIPDMYTRPDALVVDLDCKTVSTKDSTEIEERTQTLCYLLGLKEEKSRKCVIFGVKAEQREEAKRLFERLMKGKKLNPSDVKPYNPEYQRPDSKVVFSYGDDDSNKKFYGQRGKGRNFARGRGERGRSKSRSASRSRSRSQSRSRSRSRRSHSESRGRSRSRSESRDRSYRRSGEQDRTRGSSRDRGYAADYDRGLDRASDYRSGYYRDEYSRRDGRDSRSDIDDRRARYRDRRSRSFSRSRSRSGRSRSRSRSYDRSSVDYRDSLRKGRDSAGRDPSPDPKRYPYRYSSRDPRDFDPRDVAYGAPQDYRRGGYMDRPPESDAYGRPPADASMRTAPPENALPLVAAVPAQPQLPPTQTAAAPAPAPAPAAPTDSANPAATYADEKMEQVPASYGYPPQSYPSADGSYRDSYRGRDYPKYGDSSYDRRDDRYGSGDYGRRSRYDFHYDDQRRSSGGYSRMDDRYGRGGDDYRKDSYSRYSRSRSRSRSHSPRGRDRYHGYDGRR